MNRDAKKLNRRNFLRLAGLGGVGLAVAGCAVPQAPPAATTAPQAGGETKTDATQAPAEAASGGAVTIELWAPHPLEDNIKITDFVQKNFETKHPDIKFKFTQVPTEWEQKFRTAAAGNTLPDLFAVDGINVPAYTARGLTAEIVGIEPTLLDDFYPPARAEMEYGGKVYATVLETNSQALRVNMDMIEKAGTKVPTTWDELVTYGKEITVDTAGKKASEEGFNPNQLKQAAFETWCCEGEGATWMILAWIWSNGGDVYNAEKKVTFADEPSVQAVQYLKDLVQTHYIWPKAGAMQAGPEGTFYGQLIAMGQTGAFDLANLTETNKPTFKWEIAPNPNSPNGKAISGVGGWLISANKAGKAIPQSIEFLKFMTTDEWQQHVSEFGYALTGRKSIAEARLTEVPQLKLFLDAMATGKARPRSSQYPAMTEAMQQAFDEAIFGDRAPKDALTDASTKIQDALAKEVSE